jgi:predicted ester cyclase
MTMSEENRAIAQRWLDEFWSAGNLAVAEEIFAPTYVRHDPEGPMIGLDAIRRYVSTIRADFLDMHYTADDLIAEADRVVVRWTATATHTPTKRRITFSGIDILRIQEEKIVESWPCFDGLAIQKKLSATS